MELHQLRYFVEVVRTGSFTRAAARCHVTQPTLSHQIQKLEEELGEPLLQRRRQGALPTSFGRGFQKRALAILAEVKAAEEEAAAYASDLRGGLHLGLIPTVAPYLMPRLLRASREKLPHLALQITEDTTRNLLNAMREGRVDVSILSLPLSGQDWHITPLMRDEILAILPREHVLGREGRIHSSQFAGEPLVLMKEAHCLRGQSLDICGRTAEKEDVYLLSSQIDTLVALVEAGMGISFIPEMAKETVSHRAVELRSLAPESYYRTIALARPHERSPTRALLQFMEICREEFMDESGSKSVPLS